MIGVDYHLKTYKVRSEKRIKDKPLICTVYWVFFRSGRKVRERIFLRSYFENFV